MDRARDFAGSSIEVPIFVATQGESDRNGTVAALVEEMTGDDCDPSPYTYWVAYQNQNMIETEDNKAVFDLIGDEMSEAEVGYWKAMTTDT
jgi:hypothetical protein